MENFEQALTEFNKTLKIHGFDELPEKGDLQRTEEWFHDRLGMFSASRFGDLMACNSKAKGKDWSQHKWLFAIGDTALTYILERAIERTSGENLKFVSTWQMRHGTELEPEGIAAVEDELKVKIKEHGFIKFLKNAGASPDGSLKIATMDLAFELKCPATILSHYKLINEPFAEGHTYFWQVTGEMLALKVENALFCSYDPRFPKSSRIGKKQVALSHTHARALCFRLIIAEKLVNRLIDSDFTCNLRDEIAVIANQCPTDFDGLVEWYNSNIKALEL